jgi:hemerythrin-like domain-containing protein
MHTHAAVPGEALVRQLKWAHDLIRRDLATVRALAEAVTGGLPAQDAQAVLRSLRIDCVRQCQMIHLHHSLETADLFPALRRSNPALGPVVDKLEADHRDVSVHLAAVEAASEELAQDPGAEVRHRLVQALQALAADLLTHLDFEEEQISPTLRTWDRWPP